MAVKIPIVSVFDSKGIKQAERAFGELKGNLSQATKVIAGVGAALAGLTAAGIGLAKMGEQAATSNARITRIAETMGLFGAEAGVVSKRLQDLAKQTALSTGVDIDSIKATQAKLLTFKELAKSANVVGGEFDRATKAAIDLAAAGFGEAETNAVQLGKALQDPIKGITALARSGVTFTEQEKEKIRALVESNKTFEAQKLILDAIEKQVGGVADATANASDKINQAFKIFGQELGVLLLPIFDKISSAISNELLPRLEKVLPKVVQQITDALDKFDFDKFAEDIANSIGWLVENGERLLTIAGYIATFVAVLWTLDTVIKAVSAATAIYNAILLANPWTWVILGIAGAATGLVVLNDWLQKNIKSTDDYRKSVEKAFPAKDPASYAFNSASIQANTYRGILGDVGQATTKVLQPHDYHIRGIENAWNKATTAAEKYRNTTFTGTGGTFEWLKKMGFGGSATPSASVLAPFTPSALAPFTPSAVASISSSALSVIDSTSEASRAAAEAARESARAAEEAARLEAATLAERERAFKSFTDAVSGLFSNLKKGILGAFELPKLGNSTSSIIRNMKKLMDATRTFSSNISRLSQMGLNPELLQQVISAGPLAGARLASALVAGGSGAIAEISRGFSEFSGLASGIAMTGTQAAFQNQAQQNVYNINVNGGLATGADIGRVIVNAIKDYERQSGVAWRG